MKELTKQLEANNGLLEKLLRSDGLEKRLAGDLLEKRLAAKKMWGLPQDVELKEAFKTMDTDGDGRGLQSSTLYALTLMFYLLRQMKNRINASVEPQVIIKMV